MSDAGSSIEAEADYHRPCHPHLVFEPCVRIFGARGKLMSTNPKKAVHVARVKRLIELADALWDGANFNITRLTTLKSLCEDERDAQAFLLHLARLAQGRMTHGKRPAGLSKAAWELHLGLADEALAFLERRAARSLRAPQAGWDVLDRLKTEQNEYKRIPFGVLRLLNDSDLAVIEHAVVGKLHPDQVAHEAYDAARLLAEEYDPKYGSGLNPKSAAAVQAIADFWAERLGLGDGSKRARSSSTARSQAKPARGVAERSRRSAAR